MDDAYERRIAGNRRGGRARVPKGTAKLPKAERVRRAREAARALWAKHRRDGLEYQDSTNKEFRREQ